MMNIVHTSVGINGLSDDLSGLLWMSMIFPIEISRVMVPMNRQQVQYIQGICRNINNVCFNHSI